MQSNYAACITNSRAAYSNLAAAMERPRYLSPECLTVGLAGWHGEGLMQGWWLRLWQRWWLVAEEAKEEEENGRGCREERERFTVALGGRLVASCGGANGGKTSDEGGGGWRPRLREKEERTRCRKKLERKKAGFFSDFWTQFSPPYRTWSLLLFIGWKKVILSSQENKFQPLICLGRIPTVGSK